jgi:hypothetical protein
VVDDVVAQVDREELARRERGDRVSVDALVLHAGGDGGLLGRLAGAAPCEAGEEKADRETEN